MMSRHLRLMALCAGLLAAAGCSDERLPPTAPAPVVSTVPTEPSPPQSPDSQRLAALALFDAARVHAEVTTSPLTWASAEGKVTWVYGPSMQATLDGGSPPAVGTFLPTGSHTYVVVFRDALVDGWQVTLNGAATAAYSAAEWSNVSATVSADSVRGVGLASYSDLWDVTADGSAVWTSVGSTTRTTTYTPATGSRLVNNSTTNVAVFGGGSYSVLFPPAPQGSSRREHRFDNLKVAINGTQYTLDGSVDLAIANGTGIYTGEVRITSNGTVVARIYGDARGHVSVEVLVPLVRL
jgi:hypothetical protein